MFTHYCRNNTKEVNILSQEAPKCVCSYVKALPLKEKGIKLKTQFGFPTEKCTK